MSHALATVRHDGRRPSVTPGIRHEKNSLSREAATDNRKTVTAADAAAMIFRPLSGASGLRYPAPGADAPGYGYAAASRLVRENVAASGFVLRTTP